MSSYNPNSFIKYLRREKAIPEKQIRFYSLWVDRFLNYSKGDLKSVNYNNIADFLKALESEGKEEWQIRQAYRAIQVFMEDFMKLSIDFEALSKGRLPIVPYTYPNSWKEARAVFTQEIRFQHLSFRTEKTYASWIRRFVLYNKDILPGDVTSGHAKKFLIHLAVERNVSAATQNQAFNALLFLFRYVLNREFDITDNVVRARNNRRIPVVFSKSEVKTLLKHFPKDYLLHVKLIYASGLRLSECVRLRVLDLDFDNRTLIVRSGKGDKDRVTLLPEMLHAPLKKHLENIRKFHEMDLASGNGSVYLPRALARKYPNASKEWKWQYVFPSERLSLDPREKIIRRHHVSPRAIQKAMSVAVKKAGIYKKGTVHTLRHSFATHLLKDGYDIRTIQDLLGHKSVRTTMIYTHVLKDLEGKVISPLERL